MALALNGAASAATIYDSIPSPLPPNLPSQGYQCCSASEVGDAIHFSGTERSLTTVTLTMSSWALAADYPLLSPTGFNGPPDADPVQHSRNRLDPDRRPGHRKPDDQCVDPVAAPGIRADAATGFLSGRKLLQWPRQNVTFDFTGTGVPDDIIYGLSFNTQSYGATPTGVPGPYNSLNFALTTVPPTVGTDINGNVAYWNTSNAGFLTPSVRASVNVFGPDTGWSPYTPSIHVPGSGRSRPP
ncbi:MAG: hypothetical protein WDN25_18945 [Acetobacteraceae bacterium]